MYRSHREDQLSCPALECARWGLNPEKNPAQTMVPAQLLLEGMILSSFARPGLWLLFHLKSPVSLPKGGAEADSIHHAQGTGWVLHTANESSSPPELCYPHFTDKGTNVQGGSEF